MPVADNVAELYAAGLLENFYQTNIWANLIQDRSSEIPGYGKSVQFPTDTSDYSPDDVSADYTPEQTDLTDLTWGDPSLTSMGEVTLVLNKAYKINRLISFITERRIRPSLLASAVEKSARAIRETLNRDIRAEFNRLPASRNVGNAIATAAASFGNAAHMNAIDNALREATVKADYEHFPRGPQRVVVVSPAYHDIIVEEIITKNPNLVSDVTLDEALVNAGAVRYRGWTIVMDDSLPQGTANTDDANHTMYFMIRGVGIGYAGELRNQRVINSETYMGIRVLGVFTWGNKIIEPGKLLRQTTSIT